MDKEPLPYDYSKPLGSGSFYLYTKGESIIIKGNNVP
jgi:hypothetical protein